VIWDSVSREVRKRGASEPALRARSAELVEVKFQRNVSLSAAQTMRKAFPSRAGIVASIDSFEFEERFAVLPASLLLLALD
jgi:hypothetical protein